MTKLRSSFLFFLLLLLCGSSCHNATEPGITPPQPKFTSTTIPPMPIDHGIYADPGRDFIVLEWGADGTKQTTGYLLFRSLDDTLGSDGLLKNKTQVGKIESANQLSEPLDTIFVDSVGIKQYKTQYYYQVQAYNTSGTNIQTFSAPSAVGNFGLLPKPTQNRPNSDGVAKEFLTFSWNDSDNGGNFQLIVRDANTKSIMWSSGPLFEFNAGTVSELYPADGSAIALTPGQPYQWRVKKIGNNQGSSSTWQNFSVK